MSHVAAAQPATARAQRSTSLRRQITLAFGLVLAAALVALSASIIIFVLRSEEQGWRERQTERARAAELVVSGFLDDTRATLALVGELPAGGAAGAPDLLPAILRQHPELLEIVRLDARGSLLASVAQDSAVLANLFTVAQSVWFRQAAGGAAYLSDVQLSAQDDPYLIVAVPAVDGGVVAARLRLTVLESLVGTVGFSEDGQTYVVNRAGTMIAHPDSGVVLANVSLRGRPELELSELVGEGVATRRYSNFQGVPVLGVTTALPASDWLLINEVSEATATTLSRTALAIFGLGLLLVGLLLLGLGALGLDRLILRPIETLRLGAAQIARGERGYRLHLARRDEIGQVAEAFNQMAQAVQEREEQLERLAASLEQAVGERTADLRREVDERARLQDETERQAAVLRAMSTPVIPINRDTLALPLIGVLDGGRINQVQETLLREVERARARVAIIDVTGVPLIDSQVAAALIAASQSVRLLGAEVVLTGIRPEIAQALVSLGLDLGALVTRSTLESGIAYAMRRGRPV